MSAPQWFLDALASPVDTGVIEVEGATISYRSWGRPGDPGTILVHGGAAHSRWWDHVAPLLAVDRHVVALDLSGHGDSDWRDEYSRTRWAREVIALAQTVLSGPPVVIGHSLGGMVAVEAAGLLGSHLSGLVVLDSAISDVRPPSEKADLARLSRPSRLYATRAEALSRFRPLPRDGDILDFVAAHVAEQSVCLRHRGWGWKFDPRIFSFTPMKAAEAFVPQCPVALVRGSHGSVTADMQARLAERFGAGVSTEVISNAGHHLMLDAPVALIDCLLSLLGGWFTKSEPVGVPIG